MLPQIKKIKNLDIFTPTKWQTVILRNYGLINVCKLAEVLNTTDDVIYTEAERLGIEGIEYNPIWLKNGYITIIKNNWHILSYNQLINLLDMDEEQLDYILKEDDFLSVKLGEFKPFCEDVFYFPLTGNQIEETYKIRNIIKFSFIKDYAKPFCFYNNQENHKEVEKYDNESDKIVYNYSMMYGDALLSGKEIISDLELKKLAEVGVNGIWFQGVLSKLEYYPFCEKLCEGYKIRQNNLKKLISKCKRYGINVFLYLNEPRALSEELFKEKYIDIRGHKENNLYSLCSSKEETKKYLYLSIKSLVENVPDLSGIITITMSENLTNCYSLGETNCSLCKNYSKYKIVSEVNNIIYKALKASGVKTRLIANLWGWAEYRDWKEEEIFKGISELEKGIEILCVSEFSKNIEKEGVKSVVGEYSISNIGPSERSRKMLEFAKKMGHKIWAKVQVNNSWEFAVVPYIPVFNLIAKHINNLKNLGVKSFMLSWTLGGYPSLTMDFVNQILNNNKFDTDKWYIDKFEGNWKEVKESVNIFSNAFEKYPYSINILYYGTQQCGSSNLLYKHSTGLKSTMVGYPYDDIESWKGIYSKELFKKMLYSMTSEWLKGIQIIKDMHGNDNFVELKRFAEMFYVSMQSMYVQFCFNEIKEGKNKGKIIKIINEEKALTKWQMKLASEDSRIGYEASNHYYFTQNSFLEKLINLELLLKD